jgi:hypothetical protein
MVNVTKKLLAYDLFVEAYGEGIMRPLSADFCLEFNSY